MSIKTGIIRSAANVAITQLNKTEKSAVINQDSIFKKLVESGGRTQFGKDHGLNSNMSYDNFKESVPVRDYEGLKSYFDEVKNGKVNILWPGKPKYLAKTSGTTSGTKYIPITKQSLPNHINNGRNALFSYLNCNPLSTIFDGRMLFLSGSPILEKENGILIGRLSGIVNHEVPSWMSKTICPGNEINSISPWEAKLDAIINDLIKRDLRVVSGIPPWIQYMFEKILEKTSKNSVTEVFPNLELYIHGGVNYKPYKERIDQLVGKELNLVETYPASEGFIAFQDDYRIDALRLISKSGIFYEFIPLKELNQSNPQRLCLKQIELEVDYAIVLSSNAGLWAYMLGDLVRFVSKDPYRLKVTGRVKQFISAFGEHVIASEIEKAMAAAIQKHGFSLVEFLVAPQVNPEGNSLPYHEWFIEFNQIPNNISEIANTLNDELCHLNTYYYDLIKDKILSTLKISLIRKDGFKDYMTSINKIGEQFKVTRLCNDRLIADQLTKMIIK